MKIEDSVLLEVSDADLIDGHFLCPKEVKSIGVEAFKNCTNLTRVTLLAGVVSIRNGAFSGCTSLVSIILPEGVESIGLSAFLDCTSLASITLREGIKIIECNAFEGCTSLVSIILPEGIKIIKSGAFLNCKSLASIILSKGIEAIESFVFQDCTMLESIVILAEKDEVLRIIKLLPEDLQAKVISKSDCVDLICHIKKAFSGTDLDVDVVTLICKKRLGFFLPQLDDIHQAKNEPCAQVNLIV